jgi:DNA polymerase
MGEAAIQESPITRAIKDIVYDNPPKATIDFETRSACSIKDCGSWRECHYH